MQAIDSSWGGFTQGTGFSSSSSSLFFKNLTEDKKARKAAEEAQKAFMWMILFTEHFYIKHDNLILNLFIPLFAIHAVVHLL